MNNKEKSSVYYSWSESGMAVVIVLGILAIMTLLAFSFATLMRTDRAATGNYVEELRARQLIDVAIARALSTIAAECGERGLFSPNAKISPSWLVTNSFSADGLNWSSALNAISNSFGNYIPDALWNETLAAANRAKWIEINITNNNELYKVGRVAFLILDCSGFIDANFAGGATRSYGINPSEISLSALTNDFSNTNIFITTRNTDVRYETLDELNANAKGINAPVQNLSIFSYAIPGFWDAIAKTNRPQLNLAGTASQIESRHQQITNYLVRYCGFNNQEANVFFYNLMDYVDPDLTPRDFSYTVEVVPMLNEIVIESGGAAAGMMYTQAKVEIWNPFAITTNAEVVLKLRTQSGATRTETNVLAAPAMQYNVTPPIARIEEPSNGTYNVFIDKAYITINSGSVTVDTIHPSGLSKTVNCGNKVSFQVVNPLYNYEPTKWLDKGSSDTLGTNNADLGTDPTWRPDRIPLFANSSFGFLRNIGELANIITGGWASVRVYGANPPPVTSVFGLSANPTDTYVTKLVSRFGLINPNGANEEVLKALVDKMPIDVGMSETVSVANAETTSKIINRIYDNIGNFTNISDIGKSWNNPSDFPSFCNNEFERRCVIGNLIGLLNVRQQIFTVLIEAQSSSGGKFFAQNPLYQRAVVILWRDAFTGEYFVRYVKYIDE